VGLIPELDEIIFFQLKEIEIVDMSSLAEAKFLQIIKDQTRLISNLMKRIDEQDKRIELQDIVITEQQKRIEKHSVKLHKQSASIKTLQGKTQKAFKYIHSPEEIFITCAEFDDAKWNTAAALSEVGIITSGGEIKITLVLSLDCYERTGGGIRLIMDGNRFIGTHKDYGLMILPKRADQLHVTKLIQNVAAGKHVFEVQLHTPPGDNGMLKIIGGIDHGIAFYLEEL